MVPIVQETIRRAAIDPVQDLLAVAIATEPGLPGSLMVGLAAAKALCVGLGKPLIAINHIQAHIYACQLMTGQGDEDGIQPNIFPCIGFVVSGGHTHFTVASLHRTGNIWAVPSTMLLGKHSTKSL